MLYIIFWRHKIYPCITYTFPSFLFSSAHIIHIAKAQKHRIRTLYYNMSSSTAAITMVTRVSTTRGTTMKLSGSTGFVWSTWSTDFCGRLSFLPCRWHHFCWSSEGKASTWYSNGREMYMCYNSIANISNECFICK